MQDKELHQTILGLTTPWQVADFELDVNGGEIRVSVEHPRGVKFECTECDCSLPCFDNGEERRCLACYSKSFGCFHIVVSSGGLLVTESIGIPGRQRSDCDGET